MRLLANVIQILKHGKKVDSKINLSITFVLRKRLRKFMMKISHCQETLINETWGGGGN